MKRPIEKTIDWLAKNGSKVGEAAQKGDENAKNIMKFYSMWHRCPGDPGAQALTEMAIKRYTESRGGDHVAAN